MRARPRSILASYTNSKTSRRVGVVSAVSAFVVGSIFTGLVACGSSDDESGGSLVNASSSSGYIPATPSTMPQLPPGAGPRDAGVIPQMDTGTVKDTAPTDGTVPTDTGGATDAPPG